MDGPQRVQRLRHRVGVPARLEVLLVLGQRADLPFGEEQADRPHQLVAQRVGAIMGAHQQRERFLAAFHEPVQQAKRDRRVPVQRVVVRRLQVVIGHHGSSSSPRMASVLGVPHFVT